MISNFVNQYPISKTLQFSLLPVGKTEQFFNERVLEADVQRDKDYPVMKEIMDRYHKDFIDRSLNTLTPKDLDIQEYVCLYTKSVKTDEDKAAMARMEKGFRKTISNSFKANTACFTIAMEDDESDESKDDESIKGKSGASEFAMLMKPGDFIRKLLKRPGFLQENEFGVWDKFRQFTTYFTGYSQNRANMYTDEDKASSIAFRCIHENLPKFIDNMRTFHSKVQPLLNEKDLETLNDDISLFGPYTVKDHFSEDFFAFTLSQTGIDAYNRMLGGYSVSNGAKVEGLNEYINLYNQSLSNLPKEEQRRKRISQLKPLYKQILSDRDSVSFLPDSFSNDQELLDAIRKGFLETFEGENSLCNVIESISSLLSNIDDFNLDGIMFSNGLPLTDLSQKVYGSWDFLESSWNTLYDSQHAGKARNEKYFEERKKRFKANDKFSIQDLCELGGDKLLLEWVKSESLVLKEAVDSGLEGAKELLCNPYTEAKRLQNNFSAIEKIKILLDAVKAFENFSKSFRATGMDADVDETFYGLFSPLFDLFRDFDRLYDKVRNYLTAKPYSKDKIRINFNSSSFLDGWGKDYESKTAHILRKGENEFFLMIIEKKLDDKAVEELKKNTSNQISLMKYLYQKPDFKNTARLFIRSKGTNYSKAVREYQLPIDDVIDIYDSKKFKTEYAKVNPEEQKEAMTKLIDYFKFGFLRHDSYKDFTMHWKDSSEYNNVNEFCDDVSRSCYAIKEEIVSEDKLLDLVESGKVYLFRIYSKDFSEYSKGTPNLHTMYFKALFSEENRENTVFKLLGGGEVFYRFPSIREEERVIHPKNLPISNKNELNPKKKSVFDYDLVKDKRFTKRQFSIHLAITLNFSSIGETKINRKVCNALRSNSMPYVIGIDRGERNLLYISVLNPDGEIVEQKSLNEILSSYQSNGEEIPIRTDYQNLLEKREKERTRSRQEWTGIQNIKELKEGYISQVINVICRLVLKYDAVIALEDLNGGFKNSRKKVERQVYDKFETMLFTKLRFLVNKKADENDDGGLMRAYQLTNPEHISSKQDGIIFYVPAWLTSKIDPTTGFVNLLYPKYTSIQASKEFIEKFSDIRYCEKEDLFAFEFDYSRFERTEADFRKRWTVYSFGERVDNYRDAKCNGEWTSHIVEPTIVLKRLFEERGIDYHSNLKEQILEQNDKDFYQALIHGIGLVLQMRNSISNSTKPEDDYLISPVKGEDGTFFDSRSAKQGLPNDADANGAYHIALKARWVIEQIQQTSESDKVNMAISNADWLKYRQTKI